MNAIGHNPPQALCNKIPFIRSSHFEKFSVKLHNWILMFAYTLVSFNLCLIGRRNMRILAKGDLRMITSEIEIHLITV